MNNHFGLNQVYLDHKGSMNNPLGINLDNQGYLNHDGPMINPLGLNIHDHSYLNH